MCIRSDDLPAGGACGVLKALALLVDTIQCGTFVRTFTSGRLKDGGMEVIVRMSALPFGMRGIQNEKVEDDSGSIVLKLTCMKDER